jgi:hypothetical protein
MMENGTQDLVHAAGGYGPPGGPPGYGPPGGGPPMGGPPGYGPPPGAGGPPGYGPPPGGGFGPPPGGYGPPGGPPGMMMGGPKFHALAITSMILGILSVPSCCCWFLGAPMSVAGLVLGIVAMSKIRGNPQMYKGGGMAIAGIATSAVGIILDLVAIFSTIDDNLRHQYGGGGW